MKKKRIILITVIMAIVLLLGAGIGVWVWTNNSGTVTESGLDPLEEDPGNKADDNWTARY